MRLAESARGWGLLRAALSALAVAAAGALGGCNGAGERAGQEAREDVRGMRDFLRGRGVVVDTRLPER
jgi:hypothetical protein